MRRLIIEEPYSRAALWSRRLALFSLAVGAIAVLLARSQAVDPTATLSVFAGAVLVACLALLFAGTAAVVIWRTGRRGAGTVASGVFLAALLLGYPAYLAAKAVQLPLLNDVSTDLVDPPQFSRSKTALAARSQRTPRFRRRKCARSSGSLIPISNRSCSIRRRMKPTNSSFAPSPRAAGSSSKKPRPAGASVSAISMRSTVR